MQGMNGYNAGASGVLLAGGACQTEPYPMTPTEELSTRLAEAQERSRYLIETLGAKTAFVRGGANVAAQGRADSPKPVMATQLLRVLDDACERQNTINAALSLLIDEIVN